MSFLTHNSTDGGGTSGASRRRSRSLHSPPPQAAATTRSSNTLAKMIDAAATQKRGVKWSHVLHYLKAHCVTRELDDDSDDAQWRHDDIVRLESPLQAHYVANTDLALELAPTSDGHSVLRSAVPVAPLSIVRVLVHLGPAAVRHVDAGTGRGVLHTACRFPPTPLLDAVLGLLILAHPPALVQRCHQGQTPLHTFLSHHGPVRSPETTRLLCRNLQSDKEHFYTLRQPNRDTPATKVGDDTSPRHRLPEIPKPGSVHHGTKIPYNAAIIPDAVYGCWPLHYAALYGASPAVCDVIYHAYPAAKHAVDSHGRTPLHWYLGAGTLDPEHPVTMEGHSLAPPRVSEAEPTERPDDPAAVYYNRHLDATIVSLLLSSRVVRTTDVHHRNPLHWFVTYIASHSCLSTTALANCATDNEESAWPLLPMVQLLLDAYASQCLAQDQWGMTPLTLLFHTVHKIQKRLYYKYQPLGRTLSHGFGPPLALIQKLLLVPSHHSPTDAATPATSVANAAHQPHAIASMEDKAGRLPLHVALQIAASTEIVQCLTRLYPASLVHTTSTHETAPLHAAFDCEWTAPLQSVETIAVLLFQSYQAGRYGSTVDGRLAMKLEDAAGYYPIHYACHHGAAVDVMELLVDRYPACALLQKPNGDLPLQCLVQSNDRGQRLLQAAMMARAAGNESCEETYESSDVLAETRVKLQGLIRPLLSEPSKLLVVDSVTGMLPLHIAVLFEAASYTVLLRMLELAPVSAIQCTGQLQGSSHDIPTRIGGSNTYSALDLHDICQSRTPICSIEEWQHRRELLFSFCPILDSHRHRQELLDHCVRIVIDEINGNSEAGTSSGRYHLAACRDKEGNPPDLELTHTVSAMEAEFRPRATHRRKHVSKRLAPNKSRHSRLHRSFSPTSPSAADTSGRHRERRPGALKLNSSIYDDDDVRLQYDAPPFQSADNDDEEFDDDHSASSYASDDASGDETGTEGYGTHGDETGTRGSLSLYTATASGSRQRTTFEDGSGEDSGSDDDSQTFNDESTIRSTHRPESEGSHRRNRRRRNRRSMDDESKDLSRRVTFEDESTIDQNSFDDDTISHSAGSIFDLAKQKLVDEDEKKDDDEHVNTGQGKSLQTPRAANKTKKEITYVRPSYMSEVGMRLWTFFVMYRDPRNPSDHYVTQLADIIGEIRVVDFDALVSSPLPPYVANYTEKGDVKGMSFRDVASPKCRELIHRTSYFLGKYDFSLEEDILVYRSRNNESVVVAASEWQFVTEEATNANMVGISEQNIWATGEAPVEVGLTFKSHKRPVWIKFTKDALEYKNEVGIRSKLGVPVDDAGPDEATDGFVSILQHFNAASSERQVDRTYSVHSKDSRFNSLSLRNATTSEKKVQLLLHEYPFAIVYPAPSHGTLFDVLLRYGIDSVDDAQQILTQMALALNWMHKRSIYCGNLSLRNIVSKTPTNTTPETVPCWQLLHLSNTVHLAEQTSYLGGIDFQGRAQFDMETFPPEMFVELSADSLKTYQKYWKYVEAHFKISVDKALISPFVDLETGATFVAKCHFIPLTTRPASVSLPYDLVECHSSIDVWSLGQLLFSLVTGRTLFHASIRDGRLFNFGEICHWKADPVLYEHVNDFLALDLLRQLLSDEASRRNLSIEYIMRHPFFLKESERGSSTRKLMDEGRLEAAAQKRAQGAKLAASTEENWLEKRSRMLHCWDFDVLERFYSSPTEIVRSILPRKMNISLPCGILLLPYNNPIAYNAASNGTTVHAERLGNTLLQLSKACFYASSMQQAISRDGGATAHRWSLSEMMVLINLPSDDFHNVQADMAYLSARHIESFRNDPMFVARKLVRERIERVFSCFEDRDLFLYFVDEWACRAIHSDSSPIAIPDRWRDSMMENGMLFMHVCLLYVRGVSRDLDAFARLIFQADNTTVPQSWIDAARGLTHELDDSAIQSEVAMLQIGLQDIFGSQNGAGEALSVIHSFLSECDPMLNVGGMTRVVASEACLWTSTESANQLSYEAQSFTFKDALHKQKDRSSVAK